MIIPATMRAVILTGHGGYEKLEFSDDMPVPTAGSDDVLIRVGAAGVNNTDINTRIGWYSKAVAEATDAGVVDGIAGAQDDGWAGTAFHFPRIQGADACGHIVAVGSNVDPARIGERVLVESVLRRADPYAVSYLGSEMDGGFAEYLCVAADQAHQIKSALTDVELASFPCAYSTAENILTRTNVKAGERVLITGASGGVGSAAVQLAKRRGAEVVAIAGEDKVNAILALGADRVVPRGADLKEIFGAEYFDAAVDIVGGAQFGAILDCLKRGGRNGASGAIAGPIVDLDLRTLYLKDLHLVGCTVFEPMVFVNLIRYIEQGEIKPIVAATFPLEHIVAAQEAFMSKRHVGKIVLTL